MVRKDFLRQVAFGGSILLAAPIIFNACAEDETLNENPDPNPSTNDIVVDLDDANFAALKTVGGFAYKGDIIVFRTSDANYVALSKLCTHSQCVVTYNHSSGDVPCPCHGSKFTVDGAVTMGPATTNLKKYTVKKEGNTLKIS